MNQLNPLLALSSQDLKRAVAVKEQIEHLQSELTDLLGGPTGGAPSPGPTPRRRISAAGRARIVAAARARWARELKQGTPGTQAKSDGKRRKVSAEGRAAIAAAARKRWAKFHAGHPPKAPNKGRRKVSEAERARRSARLKAHWAAVRKAGGNRLR
jgi:hypothetical protein